MAVILSLVGAWAGLACLFVGYGDGMHVFADQVGDVHALLTTSVPNLVYLPMAILVAALVLAAFWFVEGFLLKLFGKLKFTESLKLLAPTFLPLSILLIIPLRYFPGLVGISSAALLLSTAMAQALVVMAVVLVAASQVGLVRRLDLPINPLSFVFAKISDRLLGWILFGTALVILTLSIPLFVGKEIFSGDQPHYLIVTHSILEDFDINIEDDHADRAYERFTTIQDLEPQSLRNSHDGHVIPFHKIGISLLAVPFYALLGKLGAVWMIGLFAAFAVMFTYRLIYLFVPDRHSTLFATAWVWLSIPLLGLSHVFMTEVPLTFVALLSLYLLYKNAEPKSPWLILLIVWTLPWLHTRGFAVAVGLTILLLWQLRGTKWLWWMSGLAIALALLVPLWNFLIYRDFSIVAQMGLATGELDILGIPYRLLGLIFDSRYGILLFNPAILCVLPGAFVLRRTNLNALAIFAIYTSFVVGPALAYMHWWGGVSPARYLAMAMPAFGLVIAAFLADSQFRRWHGAGKILIVLSCMLSVLTVVDTTLGSSLREEVPSLLASVSLGTLDAVEWWPSWFVGGWRFLVHCLLLLVLLRILAEIGQRLRHHFETQKSKNITSYSATGTLFAAMLILAISAPVFEQLTPEEPNAGHVGDRSNELEFSARFRSERYRIEDLVGNWDPSALPERGFSAIRLFGRPNLQADPEAPRGRYYPLPQGESSVDLTPSIPFWAGEYEAHILVAAERPYQHISFELLDFSTRGQDDWTPLGEAEVDDGDGYVLHVVNFVLDRNSVGLRWRILSDDIARFAYATVVPLKYTMASEWDLPQELFDNGTLRFNEYDLFVRPGDIYPPDNKWFWSKANLDTEWTILGKRDYPALLLSLNSHPPVAFNVTGSGETERLEFDIAEGHVRSRIPVKTDLLGIHYVSRIRIRIDGAYVPAEVDPESEDFRRLGAHTRIALATKEPE